MIALRSNLSKTPLPPEIQKAITSLGEGEGLLAEIIVTRTAADLIGLPDRGRIAPGVPAHLVVLEAHRFSELLSRPSASRLCIDAEEVHRPPVPDFAELNDR